MALATPLTSGAQQKAFYEANGYITHPSLLTPGELSELRGALNELLEEASTLEASTDKFNIVQAEDGSRHVRRIFEPIQHHPAFYNLAFHTGIVDAVENLIGPDIQIQHSKLNLKPPTNREGQFEWHQDYPFFPHTNYDLLAVVVHLDEATRENGCLRVIPGAHKNGPLVHDFGRGGIGANGIADASLTADESKWLYVPLPAGSIEIHHCNMPHSSTANLGDRPRSVLIFQYRAADNAQFGGYVGHYGWGTQIRGTNPYRARMLDGSFVQLPGVVKDPMKRDG
jgi:ectoine hydroxylase-related dioxygenase (phytanoyl-CoA dioxygenase family)